jgi:hypothetical protein
MRAESGSGRYGAVILAAPVVVIKMPAFVAIGTKIMVVPPVGFRPVVKGGENRIAAYLTITVHTIPPDTKNLLVSRRCYIFVLLW